MNDLTMNNILVLGGEQEDDSCKEVCAGDT